MRIKTHIKYIEEGTKHHNILILSSLLLFQILFQILFKIGGCTCSLRKRRGLGLLLGGRSLCNVSAKFNGTCIAGEEVYLPQHLQMVGIETSSLHPMNADLMSKGRVRD